MPPDTHASFQLCRLPQAIRYILSAFMIVLTLSVFTGLIFIAHNTGMNRAGISTHYAGAVPSDDDFDVPEHYAKPFAEMLITTHNHLFGFAVIFLITGLLFYASSFPFPRLKLLLMTEPFLTVLLTFGGLWLVRYHASFWSGPVIFFSVLTYICYFIMTGYIIFDLLLKR
ncbi:MAG: hypothetical protein D6677_09540 [Calditrichaeota bacterium]|nr:MAG: hypothetical protein D6677_09540 [Calditrichota bacterium]